VTDREYVILIVDDHESTRETLKDVVAKAGNKPVLAKNGAEAFSQMQGHDVDIVLTDLRLPDTDGMDIMERVKRDMPGVPVILITAHGSEDVAVSAMKRGATDYLPKPLDLNRLRAVLEGAGRIRDIYLENIGLHRELDSRRALGEIVGDSAAIRAIKEQIRQVAPTNATVLIQGENGTGKELVANAIYASSDRAGKPFVKVAVAALPRDLLESELFGHERGSFTGAHKQRKGRFELASGGTLFLDEIGTMPIETQIKLLRVLQEREFERVGGSETIRSDIRLISASNEDLEQAMAELRFRQDLYFRINVIHIKLPPLRERQDDVPLLVKSFVNEFPARDGSVKEVSQDAMGALQQHPWPGNVRELHNLIERLCITASRQRIELSDLPATIRGAAAAPVVPAAPAAGISFDSLAGVPLEELEKRAIAATLAAESGNKTRTAKALGIGLKTLYRKIESYGISV
jgi:DNA-binding NtrC family response regulator